MKKIPSRDLFPVVVLTLGVSALALALVLFWMLGQSASTRPQALLEKLKSLHYLEVLQAQLVGTQAFRQGSSLPLGQHEVIVLARGRAIYGVDLSQARLVHQGRRQYLEIPRVEVLHVILNPDSIDFAAPRKAWLTSQQEFELFRQRAGHQMQIVLNAQSRSPELLAEAEKQASRWLKAWLSSLGQKQIDVHFRFSHLQPEFRQQP